LLEGSDEDQNGDDAPGRSTAQRRGLRIRHRRNIHEFGRLVSNVDDDDQGATLEP
jgi:hypothetical protein